MKITPSDLRYRLMRFSRHRVPNRTRAAGIALRLALWAEEGGHLEAAERAGERLLDLVRADGPFRLLLQVDATEEDLDRALTRVKRLLWAQRVSPAEREWILTGGQR